MRIGMQDLPKSKGNRPVVSPQWSNYRGRCLPWYFGPVLQPFLGLMRHNFRQIRSMVVRRLVRYPFLIHSLCQQQK
ncbi:hypothetical protein FGIG_00585 [Fasciola gigantica]|uniref:Uncharacterized protein n=1 Tax=Fasciola gigantica TaxID=46835 RepID=A0A504YHU5_FASGI|nr:hypothetical protein FGIG_00585 [Fasciola gigantica]